MKNLAVKVKLVNQQVMFDAVAKKMKNLDNSDYGGKNNLRRRIISYVNI